MGNLTVDQMMEDYWNCCLTASGKAKALRQIDCMPGMAMRKWEGLPTIVRVKLTELFEPKSAQQ